MPRCACDGGACWCRRLAKAKPPDRHQQRTHEHVTRRRSAGEVNAFQSADSIRWEGASRVRHLVGVGVGEVEVPCSILELRVLHTGGCLNLGGRQSDGESRKVE